MVISKKLLSPSKSGKARSVQFASEGLVNWFTETNESTGDLNLYGRPGLTLFSDISSSPVYGLYFWKTNIYAVIGDYLYSVDNLGGHIQIGLLGTITNNVMMFDNSNELVITNPSNGSTYTYDLINGLRPITDPSFRNPSSGTFLDGYAIFSERDTNVVFISAVNDARDYSALDFTSADANSRPLVRVFGTLKYLWAFGQQAIQIFQNTDASFPFQDLSGSTLQQGCGATLSVAQIKNILFWLGEDGSIWSFLSAPKKISTYSIEDRISKLNGVADAFAFCFTEAGHDFYCITFPNNFTIVYDISEDKWYDWKTFESNQLNINCHVFAFGKNIVGDSLTGKLYYLDLDAYSDNGVVIEGIITTPNYFNETNMVFIDRFEIRFEAGVGLLSGQGENPQIMLQKSINGGKTFGKEIWRSISRIGRYDEYKAIWHNLGASPNLVFKATITDPVKRAIQGIYGVVRGGGA